jgi:GNAT superfamily N-acetyltransferase
MVEPERVERKLEAEQMNCAGDVQLRPVQAADAESVAELAMQLGYERTADEVREWLDGLGARGGQAVFVAELAGQVVGWIDVSLEYRLQSETFGLIGGLVVKDGLRGAGIGRRLCERAEQWSADQGVKKIRVTSRSTREAAHRFYLRDGYRQVKVSMVFEKRLES